jgi:phosphohistidine phosphatase
MRRLLLLRHAKTERDASTGRDHDRALEETGRFDANAVGTALAKSGLVPDLALVSTAKRAVETWDLVAPHLLPRPKTRIEAELYGATPRALLDAVRGVDSKVRQLMIVAHNPGLHEFALGLVAEDQTGDLDLLRNNLPTGAVTVTDFAVDDWTDVSFHSGHLKKLITPKMLRKAAKTASRHRH